jgi:hypothetical protein
LLHGALTFLGRNGGKLVAVRRSHHHFDGQRTKIMQTGEANLPRIKHLLDSWHQRQADTMTQLD